MKYALSIILMLAACASRTPVEPRLHVLHGTVVDESGRGVPGVLVYLDGLRGGVSNGQGKFVVPNIPTGTHTVRARIIGSLETRRVTRFQQQDSVELTLLLLSTPSVIAGGDHRLPSDNLLAAASELLPRVIRDSTFQEIATAELASRDSIIVWARWKVPSTPLRIGRRPAFVVVANCSECESSRAYTIEGGTTYTAKLAHVNVGVTSAGDSERYLLFCFDVATPQRTQLTNCGGGPRIVYERLPDGSWSKL